MLKKYGKDSVDRLSDKALEEGLKRTERKLRKDLVNTQLGLEEGWLKQESTGRKLSESENPNDAETA